MAADAVKAAPNLYKVLFENNKVRVLETRYKAKDKSAMHSHPALVACFIKQGKGKFTLPDGKTQEMEAKAGDAVFMDAQTHAVENIGNTELHVILVELK